jgi:hypothetical protein
MCKGILTSWIHPKSIAVATDLTDLEYLLPEAKAQADEALAAAESQLKATQA